MAQGVTTAMFRIVDYTERSHLSMRCSRLPSAATMKHHDQKPSGEERVCLAFRLYTVHDGGELKAGTQADTMQDGCLLPYFC